MTLSTEIVTILAGVDETAAMRGRPERDLPGTSAESRLEAMFGAIEHTILPRRLNFSSEDGIRLELTARSGRLFAPGGASGLADVARALVAHARRAGPHAVSSTPTSDDGEDGDVSFALAELRAACVQAAAAAPEADAAPETVTDDGSFYGLIARACPVRAEFAEDGTRLRDTGDASLPDAAGAAALLAELAALEGDMAALGDAPALVVLGEGREGDLVLCGDETGAVVGRLGVAGWSELVRLWDAVVPPAVEQDE
ncbi:hypothetical protein OEZ60_07715 [Defluviimonas sp. WL0024]|uniref:Uncharacterized protein n=2 Tax=Albidovulum TaxID=205889 RepID=A0ABT3J4J9_9RHOB|nr:MULTISPECIES: hypothetical protein [Defluviimonas]MCU9847892.1 hypothetical protein [Defluviimonas sp. WL0024]MCW3782395.1 hypothetical protein [Defluviimonas salinarum]